MADVKMTPRDRAIQHNLVVILTRPIEEWTKNLTPVPDVDRTVPRRWECDEQC